MLPLTAKSKRELSLSATIIATRSQKKTKKIENLILFDYCYLCVIIIRFMVPFIVSHKRVVIRDSGGIDAP